MYRMSQMCSETNGLNGIYKEKPQIGQEQFLELLTDVFIFFAMICHSFLVLRRDR